MVRLAKTQLASHAGRKITPIPPIAPDPGPLGNGGNGGNILPSSEPASSSIRSSSVAAAVLRGAREAAIVLIAEGASLRLRAEEEPAPALLAAIRRHKIEIIEILQGRRCRYCGERISWLKPGGVPFADNTAAHLGCYERAEVDRP
jgi:hypothetical protein